MDTNFCNNKHMFGKPFEGIHSTRFMGLAIVDIILTLLFAWLISCITGINIIYVRIFLLLLSIFFHWVFCVDTQLLLWIKKLIALVMRQA